MVVETIKMSSKGQIVIPKGIRKDMHADEGTVFAVIGSEDSVVLKKITTPSKEELISELSIIAEEGAKRAKKLGIKESDVSDLVHKSRKAK
ncbi:MAG: AbrB/MazE/SpoVT family DNA-binding domain-containing protein [Candidatus Woesearchaeota archaeon]